MLESLDNAVLGIDGGGTRCRLACDLGGQVLRVETGPANVFSDFAGALAQIQEGLGQLAQAAGVEREALFEVPAFVGLAGVRSEAIAAQLRAALPFKHMRVEDDRPAALRGALGDADGAIIHCGTGSFLAVQAGGQIRLAGGWGAVLGDEASARWLGWAALNAALRVQDGTLPGCDWARALVQEMGGPEGVLSFAASASATEFGAIAPKVTAAAQAGDALARSILQQGAQHMAEAAAALGWSEGMALCLTGGVAPVYAPYLPEPMATAIRPPVGAPLDGALALAREVPR